MKNIYLFALMFIFVPSLAFAFKTYGFHNPYGIVVDESAGYIYVSNINGGYELKDGNGFISRLKLDGSLDNMRYIGGASKGITLNSPKGMAIVGTRLYIADIDKLRVFDTIKAELLYNVNFGDYSIQHLIDLEPGPDGALYVTDAGTNVIYRIDVDKQHEVTKFVEGEELGGPHGICWYSERQVFIIAGWGAGRLVQYDRSGKRQALPSVLLSTLEGCVADAYGNVYISSESLNTVFRVAPSFALYGFALGQRQPAGLAFLKKTNEIIVASLEGNYIESFPAEKPPKEN
jgi:sugar lactone lactonase YvrE